MLMNKTSSFLFPPQMFDPLNNACQPCLTLSDEVSHLPKQCQTDWRCSHQLAAYTVMRELTLETSTATI